MSRTTARERTTPAAAVKPWMKRRTARIAIDGATVQSREAQTYPARPTSSGARRPRASLMGPISSWPSPRPTSAQVSVSWTADALAPNVSRSCGNAGRYMSNESGPRAAIAPRITTRRAPVRTVGTRRAAASATAAATPAAAPAVDERRQSLAHRLDLGDALTEPPAPVGAANELVAITPEDPHDRLVVVLHHDGEVRLHGRRLAVDLDQRAR